MSETGQKMAFRRCRRPQISDIVNFLACEKCKIYCTKVMIKTVEIAQTVCAWFSFTEQRREETAR